MKLHKLNTTFRSIIDDSYSTYISDRKAFISLKQKLKILFHQTHKTNDKFTSTKWKTSERRLGTIPRSSKRPTGFSRKERKELQEILSFPKTSRFVDHRNANISNISSSISALVKHNLGNFKAPVINHAKSEDVRTADQEAFLKYNYLGKLIPQSMFALVCKSGLIASHNMGWFIPAIPESKRKQTLLIKDALELGIKNSNSGFPSHLKKNNPIAISDAKDWCIRLLKRPSFYSFFKNSYSLFNFADSDISRFFLNPVYILYRYQLSEDNFMNFNMKIRQVWCIPFRIIVLEILFFNPLLDMCKDYTLKSTNPVFGIGLNNSGLSRKQISQLRLFQSRFRNQDLQFYSGDYSKFDRSYLDIFDSLFFSIWRSQITLTDNQYKIYSLLRIYTKFTPYIYKDSLFVTGRGICSGSFTTNIRGTFANLTIWCMAQILIDFDSEATHKLLNEFMKLEDIIRKSGLSDLSVIDEIDFFSIGWVKIYGDDCIGCVSSSHAALLIELCKAFGQQLNFKSPRSSTESFYFLGRYWDVDSRPYQSPQYMFAHIITRTKWYSKEEVNFDISENLELYRALSICLPFRNGREFLDIALKGYPPYDRFKSDPNGFYLLKDWPHEEFIYVPKYQAYDFMSY